MTPTPAAGRPLWPLIVIGVLIAAGVAILLTAGARRALGPRADATLLTWEVTGNTATVVFRIRRPPGQPAVCVLRAKDENFIDVGYAVLPLPPVSTPVTQETFQLATTEPAFVVEVLGCRIGQRLAEDAVIGPQFAPGVVPPSQPPPATVPGPLS
ncbi:MAG: DUF4307 domain-containing protein [Actinomycetales bacterium]|nr:DUF4307 domain-containing protein [Actinomycetales bacterium]